jgi:sugar phosphate isomerase/epimerase
VPLSLALPCLGGDLASDSGGEVIEVIASIAHEAARRGVPLADYSIPPAKLIPGNVGEVGAGVDPAAWLAVAADPVQGVIELGQRLAAARLCDLSTGGMRVPIGAPDGRLDVVAYRAALSVAGHRGPLVLDARQWAQPWEGILQSAAAWSGT